MKQLALLLVFLILSVLRVEAQTLYLDTSPEVTGSISVNVMDDATSGCWTNLREVRLYVEERLRSEGYTINDDPNGGPTYFDVLVGALRTGSNLCAGTVRARVTRWGFVDGNNAAPYLLAEHATYGASGTGGNFNRTAIEVAQELINRMRRN